MSGRVDRCRGRRCLDRVKVSGTRANSSYPVRLRSYPGSAKSMARRVQPRPMVARQHRLSMKPRTSAPAIIDCAVTTQDISRSPARQSCRGTRPTTLNCCTWSSCSCWDSSGRQLSRYTSARQPRRAPHVSLHSRIEIPPDCGVAAGVVASSRLAGCSSVRQ